MPSQSAKKSTRTESDYSHKLTIEKQAPRQFKLSWDDQNKTTMVLNFQPLVEGINYKGSYTILHFQTQPKGLRQWGIYDVTNDSYSSTDDKHLCLKKVATAHQIPDASNTMPTAVLYFVNTTVTIENGYTIIR